MGANRQQQIEAGLRSMLGSKTHPQSAHVETPPSRKPKTAQPPWQSHSSTRQCAWNKPTDTESDSLAWQTNQLDDSNLTPVTARSFLSIRRNQPLSALSHRHNPLSTPAPRTAQHNALLPWRECPSPGGPASRGS